MTIPIQQGVITSPTTISLGAHPRGLVATIAAMFGFDPRELLGPSRLPRIAFARQVGMALAHEHMGFSLQESARLFGRTDHGTTQHAIKTVKNRCDTEPKVAMMVNTIKQRLLA